MRLKRPSSWRVDQELPVKLAFHEGCLVVLLESGRYTSWVAYESITRGPEEAATFWARARMLRASKASVSMAGDYTRERGGVTKRSEGTGVREVLEQMEIKA
jgi:hypothetical protein